VGIASHLKVFTCPLQCDFHVRSGALIEPVRKRFEAALAGRAFFLCSRGFVPTHKNITAFGVRVGKIRDQWRWFRVSASGVMLELLVLVAGTNGRARDYGPVS